MVTETTRAQAGHVPFLCVPLWVQGPDWEARDSTSQLFLLIIPSGTGIAATHRAPNSVSLALAGLTKPHLNWPGTEAL